jgi:ureidoglycolate hydrolase
MIIKRLTYKSMKPYGRIIDSKCCKFRPGDNGFGIVFSERSKGWRVAYLVVRKRAIERLERHPNTAETFEPVSGRTLIALAPRRGPAKVEMFLLDKPVVLFRGVWHNVAALSPRSELKICEAINVEEEYRDLDVPIKCGRS